MRSKTIFIPMLLGLAALLLLPLGALAGTTGKLAGKIFNEETGEPLPGVAVSITGTVLGALTDDNGEYFVLNVPVGNYTVKASLIGFAPVEVTDVDVSVDLTTYTDFSLSKKALELGRTITVKAERPMIIKDKTASIKVVETEDIQNMPTRGYQDIVGFQAGVVAYRDNPNTRQRGGGLIEDANTPTIIVRGGRPNQVAYFVDGFSQQDPLSGMSTTNINNNALAEVEITTGGFSAEYGWVASGIVNATTMEGGDKYSGAVEAISDNVGDLFGDPWERYDYNLYAANIGGPLYGIEGSTFFLSGERRWQEDRQPSGIVDSILPRNWLGGWSGQGKVSLRLNDNMNVKIGGMYSKDNWNQYLHTYHFNIEHAPRYLDENQSFNVKWTHTLSPKTFYTLSGSYFLTKRTRGDGIYFDDFNEYYRGAENDGPDEWPGEGNPAQDQTGLFWYWDDIDGETPDIDEGHVFDDVLKRKSSYIGFNFDISSQVTTQHLLKFGTEFQRHTLRYYRALFPANDDTLNVDHYGYDRYGEETDYTGEDAWKNEPRTPVTFAAYLQDKFEWNDLVINAGLRFDYFNTNTKRLKSLNDPFGYEDPTNTYPDSLTLEDLEDSKAEYRLSPRIGVGFPVSDRTVVHLSYGTFFQRPKLDELYVGYDYYAYKVASGGYFYPFGNPNLEPEKTIAYEFGVSHQLNENTAFEVAAYYKDISGLSQATTVTNTKGSAKSYSAYQNEDFGTVKGLDFSLKMRRSRNIALDLSYTLSWASGTGSYSTTQSNITWTLEEAPRFANPLDFDQRHKFTGIVDIRFGKGEGPMIGNIFPLENAGANFIVNLSSGTPYTATVMPFDPVTLFAVSPQPASGINSRYGPWMFRIDMKATKTLFFSNGINLDFYVWILNLLDRDNVLSVYESSGDALSTNWLVTQPGQDWIEANADVHDASGLTGEEKYILASQNPGNYDIPRQVRFGIRMSF